MSLINKLTKWFFALKRGQATYQEVVAETITTTDAAARAWSEIEIVPDTTTAGCIVVRYVITGMQSNGSVLYSITSEGSWSWAAGGPVTRQSAAGGQGTSSANTFATPRPSHSFDLNNVRPTITGKAATTILWNCNYRVLQYAA